MRNPAPTRDLSRRRGVKADSFRLFLYVLPGILFVILFRYIPLWGWSFAFFQYKPGMKLAQCKFVGLDHFTLLFTNPIMRSNLFRVLRNTFGIHLLGYLFSPLATALCGSNGLINTLLQNAGAASRVNILTSNRHVWLTQVLLQTWKSTGWNAIIYFSALAGIDPSLYEAGRVDGIKSRFQELRYITIPMMKPQMLFGAVNAIVGAFGVFDVATAVAGMPSPNYAAHTIVAHLYDYAFTRFNMGYASAVAMALFAITFTLGRVCMHLFKDNT